VLPAPEARALPPAPPLRRMIGPGVILVGLSIGSGEFVLWPRITAQVGFAVFWACWIGVTLQFFLNMEIERYTLATGESAVTGFVRLWRPFGAIFLVCTTLPWIWPGWATGAGELLRWQIGGSANAYAIAGLVACGLLLTLGPVVYRTIETVQMALVGGIFVLMVGLALAVVRGDSLAALADGALRVGEVPEGIAWPLLLGALAFAGAGGSANLAQSNYIKDKGYGMGRWVGRITSPLTGRDEPTPNVGFRFEASAENLAAWRLWWRRANWEHALTFWLLCLLSLSLFCLLAHALLGVQGAPTEGLGFVADQGAVLETRFGPLARHGLVWVGIAVLFSTELGILDAVTRVAVDLLKSSFVRDSAFWTLSRLYFAVLWGFIASGVLILATGFDDPLDLLVRSAALNAVVMFLYSGLLLVLGLRCFAPPLRPSPLRIAALCAAFLFFGYFSAITLLDQLAPR
jgi:hypothetical protein